MKEERPAHQAFLETFNVAIGACPPENQGALLHPLQLLTSNVPLGALLGISATTQLQAVADGELAPAAPPKSARDASTTNRHKMPAPFLRPRCTSPEVAEWPSKGNSQT